ncbi:Imidazole glycerol phosphate synthase subunit HisF [bacterium HR33]|nr:Imidazole glycerol phosphate synthase subunit HisF [bacterium HR33]
MTRVAVIDSGVANLASVASAFRRLGAEVFVATSAEDLRDASHLVLPGVGAFGPAIAALRSAGLDAALIEAVRDGVPLLAICLGMQLLCEGSEESPGTAGLGLVPGICRRLPDSVSVPHLGWNLVAAPSGARWLSTGWAAFANSYALREASPGIHAAFTTHGVQFVSALEWANVLACQFHPELSGVWGAGLLRRWLTGSRAADGEALCAEAKGGYPAGLARRLIPCLDVRDDRVVKGVQFQQLREVGDPVERAVEYEKQGADEVVILDVAASPRGMLAATRTVRRVREAISIPLVVGGGVADFRDAASLLQAGADKVSLNTAAVKRPRLISELAERFGTQCVVLAIDARRKRDRYEVLINSGSVAVDLDPIAWAREGVALGAGEILLTSWDRDGTRIGLDLELLRGVARAVRVPVIASGGVGSVEDVCRAFDAGAAAVLAASVLHSGDLSVMDIKRVLWQKGVGVRPW